MAGETELLEAAAQGNAAMVRAELAAGTPVDARTARGETALLLATHGNHVEAARALSRRART